MKKSILYFLILMVFVACGGGDDTGETPQVNKDYLSVPLSLEFLADGQTIEMAINANCSWTIKKDVDWVTINPMAGANNQTVIISVTKNTTNEDRVTILTVQGGSLPARRVTITQKKATDTPSQYSMTVDKSSLEFEKDGGNQSFIITSNTNWTITCPDWCTLSTKTGNGNATITVTATKNDKTEQRTGQVVISGDGVNDVNINVTQKPADETPNEPSSGDNLPPS